MKKIIKSRYLKIAGIFIACIILFLALPVQKIASPTSTVIESSDGRLLGAVIAGDGQWRFPERDSIPYKFEQALLHFEDEYFFFHPGVNPASIIRAAYQNIKVGKIVSGGSTITMQLVRISRKGKPRTIGQKLIEIVLALRLEASTTKNEILCHYASHAPFGGNTVGLDAAAWRYYRRKPEQLSWAESATLAVLPNAPSLIFPGKRNEQLLRKRNFLLDKLYNEGLFDKTTLELSKAEPLPGKPAYMPQLAPHLLSRALKENRGKRVQTTIDFQLQTQANRIVQNHYKQLCYNQIHNAAAIIIEVETGNVLAYVGNTKSIGNTKHGNDVDVITAPRSTGSILKPFLFAAMLNDGDLLPNMLVPDIPTQIGNYAPKNFHMKYDGAVPAKQALSRSLNVPAVRMLVDYGVDKFHYHLKKYGLSTLTFPAEHYGLSLILGGAEGKLWDISGIYASMARTLNNYTKYENRYFAGDFKMPRIYKYQTTIEKPVYSEEEPFISASAIWFTFQSLLEVNRPDSESGWEEFASSNQVAWKTGTSFGFRDAWAVGATPKYVVGVWAGNADGEGRPGLTGGTAAAPIMFDIFDLLQTGNWFMEPLNEIELSPICAKSGHRASRYCDEVDTVQIPYKGLKTCACPYHKLIHLDQDENYQVSSICENPAKMKHRNWFVLPPVQEWYFKQHNPWYKSLPQFKPGCNELQNNKTMAFIYPKENSTIYIPFELDGSRGKTVFEATHRNPETKIHWHLDHEYIGTTERFHQMEIFALPGKHIITLIDKNGASLIKHFNLLEKEE